MRVSGSTIAAVRWHNSVRSLGQRKQYDAKISKLSLPVARDNARGDKRSQVDIFHHESRNKNNATQANRTMMSATIPELQASATHYFGCIHRGGQQLMHVHIPLRLLRGYGFNDISETAAIALNR